MKEKLKPISPNCYMLTNKESGVDIHVYPSHFLLEEFGEEESIHQLYNASLLPGVVSPVIGMLDIHTGYGLPIGGVMATDYENGVVSAGAVGMDINCGVRFLTTKILTDEMDKNKLAKILDAVSRRVPSGVGKSSVLKHLRKPPLEAIASEGAGYFIKMGYGWKEDLERIEDGGCIKGADASCIPTTAQNRSDQLGTIGGGNHFIEIGRVSRVFDKEIASKFGLYQSTFMF